MYPTQIQSSSYTQTKSYYSLSSFNSTTPLTNNIPHPPLVSGFDSQSSHIYYQDLNSVNATGWVVKEAAPFIGLQAVPALRREAIASTSYDPSPIGIAALPNSLGNTLKGKHKRPKVVPWKMNPGQTVHCELCKIDCTNIKIYEKHLSGKKHAKNVQKTYALGTTSKFVPAAQPNSTPSNPVDLETKQQKLLNGGTAVQSLRTCTICKVVCNGEIVYADHLSGKKHMAQVRALSTMANPNTNTVSNPVPHSQDKIKKPKNNAPARCEVCKISCTNSDGLIIHQQGKKHKKNLEQLRKTTIGSAPSDSFPSSTNQPTSVPENAEATNIIMPEPDGQKKKGARMKEPEDVETKKRKVLECGAPADAVRTCTICNVVCNSETVFKSHLSGAKHAAMVKQAEAKTGN